jgi:heterodisulfide reductase subunit A-like polyferredoxin
VDSHFSRSSCDVLVAGSGAGGFAAALTANHQGLDVILVEKEPLFGGTTAYSAGVAWIQSTRIRGLLASLTAGKMPSLISHTTWVTDWIGVGPKPS